MELSTNVRAEEPAPLRLNIQYWIKTGSGTEHQSKQSESFINLSVANPSRPGSGLQLRNERPAYLHSQDILRFRAALTFQAFWSI